jgi:ferritin-like metal-binding protein YciE
LATAEKNLNDLFLDTLKDIYFAERQILKNLPKMAKAAKIGAAEEGVSETRRRCRAASGDVELIGHRAQAKTCEAIKGILEGGEEIMEEYSGSEALDAGLLAAAQAVEHDAMSRYGTLKFWAGQLGLKDAVSLLDETFQEEKETDALLSSLAESSVNQEAA